MLCMNSTHVHAKQSEYNSIDYLLTALYNALTGTENHITGD